MESARVVSLGTSIALLAREVEPIVGYLGVSIVVLRRE